MRNNRLLVSIVMFLVISLILVACSDDESTNQTDNSSTKEKNIEENSNASSDDFDSNGNNEENESSGEIKEEEEKRDKHIEHQYGLKIGETGTVVSYTSNNLEDRIWYEVTLNELRYDEELVTHVQLFDEVFVVADVIIKNIDEQSIDLIDIVTPSFGELGTNEYHSAVGSDFLQNIPGLSLLEGELQPGESKTGNFVFDVDKSSK